MGKKKQENSKGRLSHCLATKNIVLNQQFLYVLTEKINLFIVSNYGS